MSDYIINKISEAKPAVIENETIKNPAKPATFELTSLKKAIDASGKEVIIRDGKQTFTVDILDNKITQLETDIAKLKAIKAEATEIK